MYLLLSPSLSYPSSSYLFPLPSFISFSLSLYFTILSLSYLCNLHLLLFLCSYPFPSSFLVIFLAPPSSICLSFLSYPLTSHFSFSFAPIHSLSSCRVMDIYTAARAGDLERIKYLCEVEDIDLNKKNEFDSIPLFYACLCGHKGMGLGECKKGGREEEEE